MNTPNILVSIIIIHLVALYSSIAHSQEEIAVPVSNDTELTVNRYSSATGDYLIIWLAPEYGFRDGHRSMAQLLANSNIEVWQSNIVESLFLPQSAKALRQLDGRYTADLVEYAYSTTGKKVILVGDSYASINALIGAHQWQSRKQASPHLIGAILFSPYTYAYIPPLGLEPVFMPVIDATNIPLMIYQAKGSGNVNQLNKVVSRLQQHGNAVYSKFIPDVMSLFYNATPTEVMEKHALTLVPNIKKMIKVLDRHEVPTIPVPLKPLLVSKSGIDIDLKEFKGDIAPLSINLIDAHDKPYIRNDYTNKITVVNFWATWCAPCVEEIPSLNRLKEKMSGLPFELISINYAEEKQTINDFMETVNVEFPVLIDKDGAFAKQWNVISYPSTFIIGPDGKIKYGVNSAILWDDPDLIDRIKALLDKQN